ncbi:MAG: PDZ domain-containing protein, partial [Bacteroidia bacterium]|nr:PDZ domain-containing protein [Bacteroidia bacterium]
MLNSLPVQTEKRIEFRLNIIFDHSIYFKFMETRRAGTFILAFYFFQSFLLRGQSPVEISLPLISDVTTQQFITADGNYYCRRYYVGSNTCLGRWNIKTGVLENLIETKGHEYFFKENLDTAFCIVDNKTLALINPRTKDTLKKFLSLNFTGYQRNSIVSTDNNTLIGYSENQGSFEILDLRNLRVKELFYDNELKNPQTKRFDLSENGNVFTQVMTDKIFIFYPNKKKMFVVSVDSSGPAFRAGLKKGDMIIKVNGKYAKWGEEIFKGDILPVTVLRNKDTIKIKLDRTGEKFFKFSQSFAPNQEITDPAILGLEYSFSMTEDLLVF